MGKLIIFIFLVAFVFFMAIGLTVITPTDSTLTPTSPSNLNVPNVPKSNYQHNIIIVHATDLTNSKPGLVSVWILLFFNPPEIAGGTDERNPVLVFKMVMPVFQENAQVNEMIDSFGITQGRSLNSDFVSNINALVENDGYIILDDFAAQILLQRVTGQSVNINSTPSLAQEDYTRVLQEERDLLLSFCNNLSLPDSARGPSPSWQLLSKTHFITNLPFDTLMSIWEAMSTSEKQPSCEISPSQ
jgi:hypothetical protein